MKFLATAALIAGLLVSGAASAQTATFNFSYTFDTANTADNVPVVITGKFVGTEFGNLIENISNANVWINGTAYTGPLNVTGLDLSSPAVISTDVTQSDFAFYDSGFNNVFTFSGGHVSAWDVDTDTGLGNGNALAGDEVADATHFSVSAVPEPNSAALIAAGLIAFGAVSLRRRNQA